MIETQTPFHKARPSHLKYSFFVRCMRLGMPIVALGLLGLVFTWPHFEGWRDHLESSVIEALAGLKIENKMKNPHLQATDREGRPFQVEAKHASQVSNDAIALEAPKGTLTMKDGTQLKITSDAGNFLKAQETLDLEGRVNLDSADGFHFETERAQVDLQKGIAKGKDPVNGRGPNGQVQSEEGFLVTQQGQRIEFIGRTKLVLNPSQGSIPQRKESSR